MSNKEAMDIVLIAANEHADFNPRYDEIKEAVSQMTDYLNDVMIPQED